MTQFRQICGAQLKSVLGRCERPGSPTYAGRCWQHRAKTRADREAAKAKRMAENAAQERRVDLTEARSRFVDAALSLGLDSSVDRVEPWMVPPQVPEVFLKDATQALSQEMPS